MHTSTTVLLISVIVAIVGAYLLHRSTYAGLFASSSENAQACKTHQGVLGQASGTQCGVMDDGTCKKGEVNSDSTMCVAEATPLANALLAAGTVGSLVGVAMMLVQRGKKHAHHSPKHHKKGK